MAISSEKSKQIQDERRQQILDAAIILFDESGYSNTKISDIAQKAGISKGLIYRYFDSKEAILLGLSTNIQHCIDECARVENAEQAIRLFSLRLLSYPYYKGYIPPMRVFFTAILKNEVSLNCTPNPFREEFGREYFGVLFKKGQEQGIFKTGNPMDFGDIYWKYLLGALSLLCQQDAKKENTPDLDSVLQLFKV